MQLILRARLRTCCSTSVATWPLPRPPPSPRPPPPPPPPLTSNLLLCATVRRSTENLPPSKTWTQIEKRTRKMTPKERARKRKIRSDTIAIKVEKERLTKAVVEPAAVEAIARVEEIRQRRPAVRLFSCVAFTSQLPPNPRPSSLDGPPTGLNLPPL